MPQSRRLQRKIASCARHQSCQSPPLFRIYTKPLDRPVFCIYTKHMDIAFDPAKNEKNKAAHGLDFADFSGFDAEPMVVEDTRYDYGETRLRAFGRIAGMGHMIVFTETETGIRLISFRRCHEKEMRRYE